jgi:hypothetical protein
MDLQNRYRKSTSLSNILMNAFISGHFQNYQQFAIYLCFGALLERGLLLNTDGSNVLYGVSSFPL